MSREEYLETTLTEEEFKKRWREMNKEYDCEICEDTGYYGDVGPGILRNDEYTVCNMCDIFSNNDE